MKNTSEDRLVASAERLSRSAEIAAIAVAHVAACWVSLKYNPRRANYLIDAVEPHLTFRMQRFGT